MRMLIPFLLMTSGLLLIVGCDLESGAGAGPDLLATADTSALQLQGARRSLTATAQAQIRVATAEARATRAALAASSATTQAYAFALTSTADALNLARLSADATATADARQILVAQERQAATATAQALELQQRQAQRDAENARRQADFFAVLWPAVSVGLLVIASWFAALFARQVLEGRRLRYSILESRAGTVVFVRDANVTTAQLLLPPGFDKLSPGSMPAPDYDAPTRAPIARTDVVETVLVRSAAGETVLAKRDPQDARPEIDRRLALWLLRKSLQIAGPQARQLPTAKQLGWRPETWVRAVALLKPHVITRQGRSGGTFCAEPWGSIAELYAAVGERKIQLGTAATPLPRADAVPAHEAIARANRMVS